MLTRYRKLPRNPHGRDFVIGDIHGHFSAVERELDRIGFEPARDRLISVGDLVDRGPESEQSADWIERSWFFAVMGNHEASLLHHQDLLSARFELWHDHHDWFDALAPSSQQRLQDCIAALPWALEVETGTGSVGIVHAEVPERFASWSDFLRELDDERVRSAAVSNRDLARRADDLGSAGTADEWRLAGIDWVIHGHTPRRYCRPGQLGNRLWIDTMGWYEAPVQYGVARFTIVELSNPLKPL
jgi:serine/threonine protein phosphatase 1